MLDSEEILPISDRLNVNDLHVLNNDIYISTVNERKIVINKIVRNKEGAEFKTLIERYDDALKAAESQIRNLQKELENGKI